MSNHEIWRTGRIQWLYNTIDNVIAWHMIGHLHPEIAEQRIARIMQEIHKLQEM